MIYVILTSIWIIPKARSFSEEGLLGTVVFLSGFLMTFTTSTMYHAIKDTQLKWLLRKADHISIYFMIAGSYTPFILIYFRNRQGLILLGFMWALVLCGTIFKSFATGKYQNLSTITYVLMGGSILWVSRSFFPLLPVRVVTLIVIGGLMYLVGVLFYVRKSFKYHHPIWHLFVLGGAISHWWGVWYALE